MVKTIEIEAKSRVGMTVAELIEALQQMPQKARVEGAWEMTSHPSLSA